MRRVMGRLGSRINRTIDRLGRARLAALLALALLPGGSALAQQDAITLDVRAGFDGYTQSDVWTPLTITASNTGPDATGEIRVEVSTFTGAPTTYVRPLDLPSGSRKQITLYAGDVNGFATPLDVKFFVGNRVAAETRADLQVVDPTTLLVGLWSDTPQALGGLAGVAPTSGETRVAVLTGDDLPDNASGWAALDVLAVANADTGTLSPEQRAALQAWLAGGGRLIIGGGLNADRTLAGLGEVSPLAASGTGMVDVRPLFELAAQTPGQQASTDVPAATGSLAGDASIYAGTSADPLIVWRPVGLGRVDFITPDLTLAPLAGWSGMATVFQRVLADGDPRPGWAYGFSQQPEAARNAVADVPGISLPSILQLCGFLAVYVLLIGPVNYLVLRWLKRTELAWFTIPALIVLFSGVAYVTGFQLRGSRAILHRLAVVQTWPGAETADVHGLLGVWSPRRARYDIELAPGYLARPLPRSATGALTSVGGATVEESNGATLRDVQVDVASIQPFYVQGFTTDVPRIDGRLTVAATASGLRVTGEVVNDSGLALNDASLLLGGSAVAIGDLPSGEVRRIDQVFNEGQATLQAGSGIDPFPYSPDYYYSGYYFEPYAETIAGGDCLDQPGARRRCNLFASMLNASTLGGGVYLLGWSEAFPLDVTVLNAGTDPIDQMLLIAELPVELGTASVQGQIELPPGLLSWQLVQEQNSYSYATPYDLYVYADETYEFHFQPLPVVPALRYTGFAVHIQSYYDDGTDFAGVVQALNRRTGQWDTLQVNYGDNYVGEAAAYINPSGGVNLRITGGLADFQTSLARFDVTLFGTLPEP